MTVADVAEQARTHPGTVGTWLLGIVAGIAVIVIAYSITSMSQRMDELAEKQAAITRDISWIRSGMTNVYTQSEAKAAHTRIRRINNDQYSRLKGLDSRIEVLEQQVQ